MGKLIKIVGKIKYGIAIYFVKFISHNMFKKLDSFGLIKNGIYPRPSINIMKEYFNGKKISGVEIGVLKGKNAKSIFNTLNINKLYLVDIWDVKYFKKANKNYKKCQNKFKNNLNVLIIKKTSLDASIHIENNSLDFCYIDASHDYFNVKQDIEIWSKKVKVNGIISGHDIMHINSLGVFEALKEYSENNEIEYVINPPDWYFIKKKEVI